MTTRTVREAIAHAAAQLKHAGCDTPDDDAAAIVAAALSTTPDCLDQLANDRIAEIVQLYITDCVNRRSVHEPLAYILGRTIFAGLELLIDQRVIVPLPDSLAMLDPVRDLPPNSRVHDVGTGSGAIALAAKHERPDLTVSGSDISGQAIRLAQLNAHRLGLRVRFTEEPFLPPGDYDLVLAHLPHVDLDGTALDLPPEILGHQPREAIYAGSAPHGLTVLSEFWVSTPPGTRVAIQHAPSQTEAIHAWLRDPQLLPATGRYDRVTVGRIR